MFQKKKTKSTVTGSQKWKDQAAERIAGALLLVQRSWANWMSRQEQRLSLKSKALVMGILFLAIAGYSLSLLFSYAKGNVTARDKITIRIPKMESHERQGAPGLTDPIYMRIHRFRKYLDSLATSEAGKKKLDSLAVQRPGLLDSLAKVEQLYQQLNQ